MNGQLGEIVIFAFGYVPRNYMICDGSRISKSENPLLYLIVGDTFTYDTTDPTTFAIPDLRDRFVKHPGTDIDLGEQKGKDDVEMSMDQMPSHNHNTQIEVDDTNGEDNLETKPENAFLNNNAGAFNNGSSNDTFLGGLSQKNVGSSEPIDIKNAYVKMIYAIRYKTNDPKESSMGEIKMWPNSRASNSTYGSIPEGWRLCNGDTLSEYNNEALLSIIGYKYGGSIANRKFKLPDFRNRFATGTKKEDEVGETGGDTHIKLNKSQLPIHTHNVKLAVNNNTESTPHVPTPNDAFINKNAGAFSSEISPSDDYLGGISQENRGGLEEMEINNASLGLNYIICVKGAVNLKTDNNYIGEIVMYASFRSYHTGFLACYGQMISKSLYQSLFTVLGTYYGGDGRTTFGLPNLKNKIPLCLSNLNEIGKQGGANSINLKSENLPEHNHNVKLTANNSGNGTLVSIDNGILNRNAGPYSTKDSGKIFLGGVKDTPFSGDEVDIRNPFLSINYLIRIDGHIAPKH